MSWKYSLSTGDLLNPACSRVGIGYSGRGIGLNNPVDQEVSTIGNFFDDPGGKGPLVAHLSPAADTERFGRSGFMIHGDNEAGNYTASEGYIILPRVLREMVMSSSDRALHVTA